jgi:hypothetical protein
MYWTILASLEWNQLESCMILLLNFVYKYFTKNFCVCVHQENWPVIFFIFLIYLSGFGIGIILASKYLLGSIPSITILCNNLRSIGVSCSLNVWQIQLWICLVLGFPFLGHFTMLQSHCSFWICLGRSYPLGSILVGYMCLRIYPFLLDFPIC